MGPFLVSIAFAVCLGVVVNILMNNKISPLALKFGGAGLAIGVFGGVLGLLSAGEILLFTAILFCTGLILAELRKEKED